MAIMIPNRPHAFAPASLEGVMFTALEKLPDEYYVFHSLTVTGCTAAENQCIMADRLIKQHPTNGS